MSVSFKNEQTHLYFFSEYSRFTVTQNDTDLTDEQLLYVCKTEILTNFMKEYKNIANLISILAFNYINSFLNFRTSAAASYAIASIIPCFVGLTFLEKNDEIGQVEGTQGLALLFVTLPSRLRCNSSIKTIC